MKRDNRIYGGLNKLKIRFKNKDAADSKVKNCLTNWLMDMLLRKEARNMLINLPIASERVINSGQLVWTYIYLNLTKPFFSASGSARSSEVTVFLNLR